MTKIITDEFEISEFMSDLIDTIRFPGALSCDAHGFCQTKEGEPIFIFGSPNSSILLWNEAQTVVLRRFLTIFLNFEFNIYFSKEMRKKTQEAFSQMTNEKFQEKWFSIHNMLSDLQVSGLQPRRLICLMITFDPSDFSVTDLK